MKYLLSIICISLAFAAFSKELGLVKEYEVKSNKKDLTIPKGYTKIHGNVSYKNKPVHNARISSVDHSQAGISNKKGNYSFLIKSSDTAIYVFKPYHQEIVIPKYDFKDQHAIEINFFMSLTPVRVVSKPVIYLYPESNQLVELAPVPNGKFTFTYPQLIETWKVLATSTGELTVDGKTYPYLFWEGKQTETGFYENKEGEKNGFTIKTDTAIQFLENSLKKIGLNQKEQTDFITFWGPKIIAEPYANIQFLIDEEYESEIATLNINPKPTSSKRVYMLFAGSIENENPFYHKQVFQAFERKGFVLIEWGGSVINPDIDL